MPRDDGVYEYISTPEERDEEESKLSLYKKELNLRYAYGDRIYIVHNPRFKKIKITYEKINKVLITNIYNYYTECGYLLTKRG
jgi:hypothetical protein